MMRRQLSFVFVSAVLVACGSRDHMTNPGSNGAGTMGGATGAAFMSLVPQGGWMSVSTTTALVFRFGGPMGLGMEQYVDLHVGGLDGPLVAMSCGWSSDRTTLTCTPGAPLRPRTTYAVHVGSGMLDGSGRPVSFDPYGPMMGGQWIAGGMMTGNHAGVSWSMMGPGWRHANGSYGMLFTFTTA